jgi:hypothetical protein
VVTGKLDVREAATQLPDEVEEPELLDDVAAFTGGDEPGNAADTDATAAEVEM